MLLWASFCGVRIGEALHPGPARSVLDDPDGDDWRDDDVFDDSPYGPPRCAGESEQSYDGDMLASAFIAARKFRGHTLDMVFKFGPHGLGYYRGVGASNISVSMKACGAPAVLHLCDLIPAAEHADRDRTAVQCVADSVPLYLATILDLPTQPGRGRATDSLVISQPSNPLPCIADGLRSSERACGRHQRGAARKQRAYASQLARPIDQRRLALGPVSPA